MLESFYVDSCVTIVDNKEQQNRFIEESKTLLSNAKFELRGWEQNFREIFTGENVPVLGLIWNIKRDTLVVDLKEILEDERQVSKINILSFITVNRTFDPIGYICPVTIEPKILLQVLCWKTKLTDSANALYWLKRNEN